MFHPTFHLTDSLKSEIIALYKQNVNKNDIAARLHLSHKTVNKWILRYEQTGDVTRRPPGFKPYMYLPDSERQREIIEALTTDASISIKVVAAAHGVSESTVRKHLHSAKLERFKTAKKDAKSCRKERVRFAQEYQNFDWQNNIVIFTGSYRFADDGTTLLWQRRGEKFIKLCDLPKCSDKIGLAYWGWISSMGPGELIGVDVRFNRDSDQYMQVLRDVMLPTVRAAYPEGQIYLVHEYSPVQTAPVVQDWLETRPDITVIYWPTRNADLNLYVHLWAYMARHWDTANIKSSENLNQMIHNSWESIRGSNLCLYMVQSMENRLKRLIESEGRPLHY